jgi:hypothetical protein
MNRGNESSKIIQSSSNTGSFPRMNMYNVLTSPQLTSWINQESDSQMRGIKDTLASHVDFISKEDFDLVVNHTIQQATFPDHYAYLHGYKPHSSKRRMYMKYASQFPVKSSHA